jgi:hypothetical protein
VANNSKSWKNKNIDFRVAKESEQVLVQDWVASPDRREEDSLEITVSKKHCNSPG